MRFFVSSYSKNGSTSIVIYITNEVYDDRSELLNLLREHFGPWMFLGIREYSKSEFLQQYSDYIPKNVVSRLDDSFTAFTYKTELYIN